MLAIDENLKFYDFEVDGACYLYNPDHGLLFRGSPEELAAFRLPIIAATANAADLRHPAVRDELILLVTDVCNLSCIYCYSQSDPSPKKHMMWEIAKKAIDHKFESARNQHISVFFHGDGEPSMNFPLIQECTNYIDKRCLELGYTHSFKIISNGVFSEAVGQFLIKNAFQVIISIDGPEAIQNVNRPLKTGEGSYAYVVENVKTLRNAGLSLTARTTISDESIDKMLDIVKHFKLLGFKGATLEPVKPTGRAIANNILSVNLHSYALQLCACIDYGIQHGMRISCFHELRYPSLLDRVKHKIWSFCGSNGEYMIVSPDGNIRSCFEYSKAPYKYGNLNAETMIDMQALGYLKERNSKHIRSCRLCFAQHACAGGCSYAAILKTGDYCCKNSNYCESNRIIIAKVLSLLNKSLTEEQNFIQGTKVVRVYE